LYVEYQGSEAVVTILDGGLIEGGLPPKKRRPPAASLDRDPRGGTDGGLGLGDKGRTGIQN
jgi:hypothetical protein